MTEGAAAARLDRAVLARCCPSVKLRLSPTPSARPAPTISQPDGLQSSLHQCPHGGGACEPVRLRLGVERADEVWRQTPIFASTRSTVSARRSRRTRDQCATSQPCSARPTSRPCGGSSWWWPTARPGRCPAASGGNGPSKLIGFKIGDGERGPSVARHLP